MKNELKKRSEDSKKNLMVIFMKKIIISALIMSLLCLYSCGSKTVVPESFETPQSVIDYMIEGNNKYVNNGKNTGDISENVRKDTANNGQSPYAVVITCSDSRVPPEHVFNAGIGELFVIRTAGNVIGDYELGSVEYGAEHLHTKLVLVLGHTNCGAVDAALSGGAHGYIEKITDEISSCLPEGCDAREAEILNVKNSIAEIMKSEIMQEMTESGAVEIRGAVYNIESGEVEFLDN